MQEKLTSKDVEEARKPHYVDTLYGRAIGFRRISSSAFLACQGLFQKPVKDDDSGALRDPMKVGFQDVGCPTCEADRGASCAALVDGEPLPHEDRVGLAITTRSLRGVRAVLKATIIDPKPDSEFLAYIEGDSAAFRDLGEKALYFNGLTEKARDEITETFRESPVGPQEGDVSISG